MLCFVYTNFSDIGKLTNSVCSVYETAISNGEFSKCFFINDLLLQSSHAVYQFLSGAAITPNTQFLSLKHQDTRHDYHSLVVFASYAVTAHDCRQRLLLSVPQCRSSCTCRNR